MNYYWLRTSFIVLVVVNIALAVFLFYQNREVSMFDDSQLPSIVTKMKGEFLSASDKAKEYTDQVSQKAQEYSDRASSKLSEELNKASSQLKQFQTDYTEFRAKTEKKIEALEKAARK